MSLVRNRHTNETFQKNGRYLVKQTMFKQPEKIKVPLDFSNFISDFKNRLPGTLTQEVKDQLIKEMELVCKNNADEIKYFIEHPKTLALLKNVRDAELKKKLNNNPEDSSFLVTLFQSMVGAKLGLFAPVIMALSAFIPGAAANLPIKEGVPPGGQDLCNAFFGCLQGYLEGTFTQIQRHILDTTGKGGPTDSYYLQLKNGINLKELGTIANNVYQAGANDTTVCTTQSAIWHGYQVTTQITNIAKDQCSPYQRQMNALVQNNMSSVGALKYTGIILGSVLGGVALIGLCVAAFYFCGENCCEATQKVRNKCPC